MLKPLVYIASPYTKGDCGINTRAQLEAFNCLLCDGVVCPLAPLWSHFQHIFYPQSYETWMQYDMQLIARCDACLRIDAEFDSYCQKESSGADREVAEFKRLGLPVFFNVPELYIWASQICLNV
ncbi:MAG: hypothetical protein L0Z53_19085 [Acidobacteriales bacterium]|nr:hypothetical protein [Terriglobales bacterium]